MLTHRGHWQLRAHLMDARVALQTAEMLCDAQHSFGYAQDLEQIVYELDRLLADSLAERPRRRRQPATG